MSNSPSPSPTQVPSALRWSAWIAVVSIIVQTILAVCMLAGIHLGEVHEGFGYLTLVSSIVAAVTAVMWKRRGGPAGVMGHALGEMGHPVKWVHVVLGFVIVVGLLTLPLSLDKKK